MDGNDNEVEAERVGPVIYLLLLNDICVKVPVALIDVDLVSDKE